jgi:excinuclease ABC subunit C
MRDAARRLLYIGKAANLRRRVQSYFTRPHDARISKLVSQIQKIDHKETATALEALILEAALIKKYQPPYNIQEKDDTSFLYVVFTKEKFPRLILTRGGALAKPPTFAKVAAGRREEIFGPFVQGGSIREALRLLRKIFPWSIHRPEEVERAYKATAALPAGALRGRRRPCFEYELGLCPGTCVGLADEAEYAANIRHLKQLFRGKRPAILRELEREMRAAAKKEEFEKAARYRKQLFALKHIQDIALIKDSEFALPAAPVRALRIEGYDVSNISGTSATGSMVVFRGDRPATDEYRLFKIHSLHTPNDVGMLREVLARRFRNHWPLPDLVLIDGGRGQVDAAQRVLAEAGLAIPIVGLVKGSTRKRTDIVGNVPKGVALRTLVRVRDEAHRFARNYHVRLRERSFIGT